MTLRTKSERKAYLDGYEMCADCVEKYLTDEGKQKLECLLMAVRNAVEIEYIEPLESEEYVEKKIENYTKMLKSGILDCVIEKSQESEDEEAKHTEERTKTHACDCKTNGRTHACDCISRQAALEVLDEYAEDIESGKFGAYTKARIRMRKLPSVDPERMKGMWLKRKGKTLILYGWYQCSQCGAIIGEPTNYCSECGARMEVDG